MEYKIKDIKLFKRALTHSSKSEDNYERLEYLGDSILEFIVSEFLFFNCKEDEGKLTVLRSHFVSENYLSKIFDKLPLKDKVMLGKSYQGEISKAIKGDVIEALLAAIYLDGGLDEAKKFVYNNFELDNFNNIVDENYKSKLQELIQGNFKCKMKYDTYPLAGGFTADFYMDEDKIATGNGKSKQDAEQLAAKAAIQRLFKLN